MLCGNLEDGWEGGSNGRGRHISGLIYVYIWLIRFIAQQKLTQYCKVIKLQ